MGVKHLGAYLKIAGVEVAAVCSDDPLTRSGDLTKVAGNLPGRAGHQDFSSLDFSKVRKYQDWQALVEDPELDAVDVCLPSDLHAAVAIGALAAGKHVLCEKPMALSIEECDRMLAAAEKHAHTLMIGQVLRFWPEYTHLRDFVNGDEYGRVRTAAFVRRCGAPNWSRWLHDEARSGGAILDLLSHDIDQALSLFGLPDRVAAKSIGGPDTAMATLIYPGGPEVRIQGGWFAAETRLSMSFQIRAERAELDWTPGASLSGGLTLSDQTGQRRKVIVASPDTNERDPYEDEVKYFVDCCRTGTPPARCPAKASALAVKIALMIKESRAAGGQQVQCAV